MYINYSFHVHVSYYASFKTCFIITSNTKIRTQHDNESHNAVCLNHEIAVSSMPTLSYNALICNQNVLMIMNYIS